MTNNSSRFHNERFSSSTETLHSISNLKVSYLEEFSIEICNDDVDQRKKNDNNKHHVVVHLFFACSSVFVEYLEHMHRCSRVQFERRTNDIYGR